MDYDKLKAWIIKTYWDAAQVAGWVRSNFYPRTSHQRTSNGAASSGLPIVLDSGGKIDASFIDDADIDHGGLAGNGDDDHAQYALLAGRSGGQTITGIASTGYALQVYRNLTAASTDSAVFRVHQDHASDDQPATQIVQDGTGNILELYDGATLVVRVIDGGKMAIGPGTPTDLLHLFHSGDAGITVEHDNVGNESPWYSVKKGSNQQYWAMAGATSSFLAGAATGDMVFRGMNGKLIHLGIDNGSGTASPTATIGASGMGVGIITASAKLHVEQTSTTAAIPTLRLKQSDLSEEMIRFDTTVGAGNPVNTTALGAYYGRVRVYVEGVGAKWLALYD